MPTLFDSYQLGPLCLRNRIVMAPMTRSRAIHLKPTSDMIEYYVQRATAGLIVSEGINISPEGRGQVFTPGLYTAEQVQGWRTLVHAVHQQQGVMFAQLWHVGRNSHASLQPGGAAPVSSVTRRSETMTWGYDANGNVARLPTSEPRALQTGEVPRVTRDFVAAARNAIDAEFDGVELHGANGYLFEQFINGALNTRTDAYGGSIANRLRFTLDTVDAVAAEIGGQRTGIRLSPFGRFGDLEGYPDEERTWLELAAELSLRGLAYVHLSDMGPPGPSMFPAGFLKKFRRAYRGTLIVAGGYLKQNGQRVLDQDLADLIAMGRPFIANPDLVLRLRKDYPLAELDRNSLYERGPEGLTDYPTWAEETRSSV